MFNKFMFRNVVFSTLLCASVFGQTALGQEVQNPEGFLPGRLIVSFNEAKTLSSLEKTPIISQMPHSSVRHLAVDRFFLLTFPKTLGVDSLILELKRAGLEARKDYVFPADGAFTLVPNEFYNVANGVTNWAAAQSTTYKYWGSRNYDPALGPVGVLSPVSNSMDSVLSFMPPLYSNNTDDTAEQVSLVHTEVPNMKHIELPDYDSANSWEGFKNIPIYSTTNGCMTSHGGLTSGMAVAKWNNRTAAYPGGGMAGMTNNRRIMYHNISIYDSSAYNGYASSSGNLAMLGWSVQYLQDNPSRKLVVTRSFSYPSLTGNVYISNGVQIPGPDAYIKTALVATGRFLLVNAASNSNAKYSAYAIFDTCMVVVGASDFSGGKAYFSNWGVNVDAMFCGYGVMGLSTNTTGVSAWSGTSASTPGLAGALVTLWNLMPNKTAAEMKAMIKDTLNTLTLTAQPDNSRKPVLNTWHLLSNQIWDIKHLYRTAIDAHDTTNLDLASKVNDLLNTQTNRKFYLKSDTNWNEVPNGQLDISKLSSGYQEVKYSWTNSQTFDSLNANTQSEIVRGITVFHTKPQVEAPLTWCVNTTVLKFKFKNKPQTNSLDSFSVFANGINITANYNNLDSMVSYTPLPGQTSVNFTTYIYKKTDPTLIDSSSFVLVKQNTGNTTMFISAQQSLSSATLTEVTPTLSSTVSNGKYAWYVNNVLVDSTLVLNFAAATGDSIYCKLLVNDTCAGNYTALSNGLVILAKSGPLSIENMRFEGLTISGKGDSLFLESEPIANEMKLTIQLSKDAKTFVDLTKPEMKRYNQKDVFKLLVNKDLISDYPVRYYRIQLRSPDGYTQYSTILKLSSSSKNQNLAVYPNPASKMIFISKKGAYSISNAAGQFIKSGSLAENKTSINIQDFVPGTYTIIFEDGTSSVFVKQ